MEPSTPRQLDIVSLAKKDGRVSVDGLAEQFQVTPQTIRKDLNELVDRGLLHRFHGGAVIASGVANVSYEARRLIAPEEKKSIGVCAARLIPNNSSILINIGTTTEQVATALRFHTGMMAITNNIHVINILGGFPEFELVVAGGVVRQSDLGVLGEAAMDFIRQFHVDIAVVGASAIGNDGTLLDYDYREVKVSKAIIECARYSILVADSTKYSRNAPVRIGHLSDIDTFVTNTRPPENIERICDESDVKLKIADPT
ncbi:MAG: DeoR/GlpR family DNA-binding transcription regulator [Methyloligellaceae bacterium]